MNDIQIRNMISFFYYLHVFFVKYEMYIAIILRKVNNYFVNKCFRHMMIILKDIYIRDKLLMYFMIYYQ